MNKYEQHEYDVLIVGAGGAGLRAAIEASALGAKTALVCKSLLGKAIGYARNQWQYLSRYVEDGRAPIDNNVLERDIRPAPQRPQQLVHLGPFAHHPHRAVGVRERQVAALRAHQVEVELAREALLEPAELVPLRQDGHHVGEIALIGPGRTGPRDPATAQELDAEAEVLKVWNSLIDPGIVAHAQPTGLNKGTLFVTVDSSPWLNEIVRYRRREILDRLQHSFGRDLIARISFRIG